MKEYRSIREVLIKGHLYVNGIATLLMLLIWILFVFFICKAISEEYIIVSAFVGFILGFLGGWFYWGLAIPRWRIWAFNNIERGNYKKLKNRAINGQLIWPDKSIFNKFEIRSAIQSDQIEKIEKVILEHVEDNSINSIEDDINLSVQTDYYYARSELILNPILLMVFIGSGIFLIVENKEIFGVIGILTGFYNFRIKLFKDLFNSQKQMSISEDGIKMNIENLGFVKWSNTKNIFLDTEQQILTMDVWRNNEEYNVTYDVGSFRRESREDMIRKINVYLKRNELKNGN